MFRIVTPVHKRSFAVTIAPPIDDGAASRLSQPLTRAKRTHRAIVAVVLAALMALLISPVAAQQATPVANDSLAQASTWLLTQQAEDGGFVGFSGTSDAATTVNAVIALAAARDAGIDVDLTSALEYLEANALVYTQSGPGQAANLALAFIAAGQNPRDIGGVDPVSICEVAAQADGIYGTGVYDHALIVLTLSAAGSPVPDGAFDALRIAQNIDGSWAFDGVVAEGSGDTNTTALVIQALVAGGKTGDIMVLQATRYLRGSQLASGAFPFQPAAEALPDANSTAIALQGLIAAGEDVSGGDWRDIPAALTAFQNDSGAFRYQDDPPDDNLFATMQAIPAIAGRPLPLIPPASATPVAAATPVASPDSA